VVKLLGEGLLLVEVDHNLIILEWCQSSPANLREWDPHSSESVSMIHASILKQVKVYL